MDSSRPPRFPRTPGGGTAADDARSEGGSEGRYSIRVTSRLTSIELDTLRMWERRYGFPRPDRTSGGNRMYSEADVTALKLIKSALGQGYRPGEVVGKSIEELSRLVVFQPPPQAPVQAPTLAALLAAVSRDQLPVIRSELSRAAVTVGPQRFVVEVAHPLCVRVGELWADGKLEVHQEHLLTECLFAQLRQLMSTHDDRPGAPRVLLATLPNERHGLGLAMTAVYLTAKGVTPILLGVDTPAKQIVTAARNHGVDAVGLLVTESSDLSATEEQLRWMLGELPRRVGIWLGGAGGGKLGLRDEALQVVPTWSAMDDAIAKLPPVAL